MLEEVSLLPSFNSKVIQASVNAGRVKLARLPVIVSPPHDLFVATLAHELRQPLSTMLAAVAVVRQAPGTDAALRAADVMQRQLGQMGRLVDDLVDAARWAHGKVPLGRCQVDLSTVIADAAADVEAVAVSTGRCSYLPDDHLPLWVTGDRRRLLQVISNLLGNAVEYSSAGWEYCDPGRANRTNGHCADQRHRTRNLGERPAHVFELFSQVTPHEGTGLGIGLSIVRENRAPARRPRRGTEPGRRTGE